MKNFGLLKSKILSKLTESYSKQNKKEVKDILGTIKENKSFKELYLFYEEIENKYFEDKETAQLYVEGMGSMLKQQMTNEFKGFCQSLDEKVNVSEINENEIYTALDHLSEEDTLSNLEKKVKAKKKLVEHLTTKKEIVESVSNSVTPNESLLHAVLANNFNVLYSNTMNESQKEELKNILSLSEDELNNKTTELKESILTQVGSLLSESNNTDLTNKLSNVEKEVKDMKPSKYNYYRLNELKNGLN